MQKSSKTLSIISYYLSRLITNYRNYNTVQYRTVVNGLNRRRAGRVINFRFTYTVMAFRYYRPRGYRSIFTALAKRTALLFSHCRCARALDFRSFPRRITYYTVVQHHSQCSRQYGLAAAAAATAAKLGMSITRQTTNRHSKHCEASTYIYINRNMHSHCVKCPSSRSKNTAHDRS